MPATPSVHRLRIRDLSVRYPRAARPVLDGARLTVGAGEVVALLGSSGVGKSTLLHAAAGLVPWMTRATATGSIEIDGEPVSDLDPGQRARVMATALARPEAQLFLATVHHEIEAARRLYGSTSDTDAVVESLGLGPLLHRRVTELSSGERQRVALAVVFAACPRPMLLDEPTAHLDEDGRAALAELLRRVTARGGAAVVAEQAGWRLGDAVGAWNEVAGGRVRPVDRPRAPLLPAPGHGPGSELLLGCRGLSVSRGGRPLIEAVDLDLHLGEVVVISGPNGSGKSTLATVLAGLRAPDSGTVRRTGRVALMLPEAELQLFATTVAGEAAVGGSGHEERARVLRLHRLDHLAARAPWTLSRGEQQRLVHAALDLLRPQVMIVDEPGQGLGSDDLADLFELVRRRSARGRAYLVISHRPEVAAAAHRRFVVRGRRLEEVAP